MIHVCHKVFTSKTNVFHSISVDSIFAQNPPLNCYNFPGMAERPCLISLGILIMLYKFRRSYPYTGKMASLY